MNGYIRYYKLTDWFCKTFSDEEQRRIESLLASHLAQSYGPPALNRAHRDAANVSAPDLKGAPAAGTAKSSKQATPEPLTLTRGKVTNLELSCPAFLHSLADALSGPAYLDLAARVRAHAHEVYEQQVAKAKPRRPAASRG